ncbi:SPOSA6832_01278, partial [Sporobolomyces salmonicolor]
MASKTLAVILGAGPGTGQALAVAFAKHHSVALLARNASALDSVAAAVRGAGGDAAPFSCDATNAESVDAAFAAIRAQWPNHQLKAACFNAANPFVSKPFLELEAKDLKPGLDLNVYGAFHFCQKAIPEMLKSGGGFLCFSGATASTKGTFLLETVAATRLTATPGSANFAAFAPAKFALRGLSQSLAREFGPQGIHVVHAIIDGEFQLRSMRGTPRGTQQASHAGIISTARIEGMMGKAEEGTVRRSSLPDEAVAAARTDFRKPVFDVLSQRLEPSAIADTILHLSQQDRSCWTQEIDMRPFSEKW